MSIVQYSRALAGSCRVQWGKAGHGKQHMFSAPGKQWWEGATEKCHVWKMFTGASRFYCSTCIQFRWNLCNYEIKMVIGSLSRKAAGLTTPPVLKPEAARLLPHCWAKSRGNTPAVKSRNISSSGDTAGLCALAHFLLLSSVDKVNCAGKNGCFPCDCFFSCFYQVEHLML